jgi:hypothetical protein
MTAFCVAVVRLSISPWLRKTGYLAAFAGSIGNGWLIGEAILAPQLLCLSVCAKLNDKMGEQMKVGGRNVHDDPADGNLTRNPYCTATSAALFLALMDITKKEYCKRLLSVDRY